MRSRWGSLWASRWIALLSVLISASVGAAPLQPGDSLEALPAASVLCISPPGATSAADALRGRCGQETRALPAEVWFRFALSAGAQEALLITSDVYTVKGGRLSVWTDALGPDRGLTVSTSDPIHRRRVRDGRLVLPVQRDPSAEVQVVVRLPLRDRRNLREPHKLLLLSSRDGWAAEQGERAFGQGLFFGLLSILVIYYGFLFYAEHHAASGWYAGAVLSAALYFATTRSVGPLYLWPGLPGLTPLIHPSLAPILVALALSFTRAYAQLGRRGDRAVRFFAALSWLCAAFAPIVDPLVSVALAATVVNGVSAASLITLFAAAIPAARRGDRPALVLLLSWVAPMCGAFAQIGVMSGLLAPNPLVSAFLQLGLSVQAVTLGIGLADRVRQLRRDRDRTETVLRLTLPAPIAERLKAGETSIADRHAEVGVLFADLAGFTTLSARRRPEEVVQLLDALFSEFDQLALQNGAEKIKTIGDCYMAVAGAPHPHPDPAAALAELALGLPAALERALARVQDTGAAVPGGVALRVGLHLGPVVAGVLGQQKLAYDMWGDTVNTASRMESHGLVGRVQCTQQIVERLHDRYVFEPRGEIEVRGKGTVKTWFLIERKGTSAAEGTAPTKRE